MKLWSNLFALFRRNKLDAEMAEEMRLHLELQTERNVVGGMNPREAQYAATRTFGGVEQIKEIARDQRGLVWLEQTFRDLRYGVRSLVRSPAVSATAVLTLALGVGACGAIYTIVDSVLLRPVAFAESERLMILQETHPQYPLASVSPANFRLWQERADLFQSLAVRTDFNGDLVGQGSPVLVKIAGVTGQYFQTLRVQPLLGRVFDSTDDTPAMSNVVVLTHAFWQRQFGGRQEVLGTSIRLTGGSSETVTVIGVLPPGFAADEAEVFMPASMPPQMWETPGRFFKMVIGRLKAGVSVEQARAQMDAIALRVAEEAPAMNEGWTVRVTPMLEFQTGRVRPTLYALLGAAVVLLVISCANLSGLLLVRTTARDREMVVRAALGASRGRIARQLLAEGLVLAATGGALGLLAAKWGVSGLMWFAPADLPRALEVAMTGRIIAISLGASLLLGLAFGFLPAWYGTRLDMGTALKGANRNTTEPRGAVFSRHILVVAQFAFALVLLSGAGLLLRSFVRLSHANPGFSPNGAVTLWVYSHNRGAEKQIAFTDSVLSRFTRLPGVTAAGATVFTPFSGENSPRLLQIEHREVPEPDRAGVIHYPVTPGYFDAMQIPLRRGRVFTRQDGPNTSSVAIVSQSIADRFFQSADPIGQRIKFDGDSEPWREIVGVVGDLRSKDFRSEMVPQVYVPFTQAPSAVVTFVVRAAAAAVPALPSLLRSELGQVAPELPVFRMASLEQLIGESIARERFSMVLIGSFAGVALILAATGMFGVIAYSVSLRRREFGIRLALGARPRDLVRFVLTGGLSLVAAGLIVGGAGALIANEFIRTLLYETAPRDPMILATVAILLSSVALVACWLPARRAARVDPVVALRCE